jgi:hypothetical protein
MRLWNYKAEPLTHHTVVPVLKQALVDIRRRILVVNHLNLKIFNGPRLMWQPWPPVTAG